jgi:hypothetical protein
MSYNTKGIPADGSASNFIDVGIHDNVELTNIRYDKSPKEGNKFLVFEFKSEKGQELAHTEWEPRDADETRLNQKITNQIKRIKHIAKRYMPEEDFNFEANDFEGFALKTIQLFGDKYKARKVRIKVVYSNSNYTSLPNYVPFIEGMDVPREDSKLEILSIDKMVRDRADREAPSTNPLEDLQQGSQTTTNKADDLPF